MSDSFSKITDDPIINAKRVRIVTAIIASLAVIFGIVWSMGLIPGLNAPQRANSLMTIQPYRHNGTWVFDDLSAGLVEEPFVAGMPEMIDFLVADIPNAEKGFRLLFSAREFPGHQQQLNWIREESGGNYYRLESPEMEGWICPALFKYFSAAPAKLFVKAEPIDH